MALVYLVNKPQVSGRIARWLLLSLEYDFTVMYKLGRIHVTTYALSKLPVLQNPHVCLIKPSSLFYIKTKWLKDVIFFLRTKQIEGTLSILQK